ncbi:MAG TPA: flagellar M-ring protein FliF C-terminal domain-containing protein, partial [Microbacteriaceae bacterium]|nr:flagellar M-ring protein FliF C-terminal domain-containing protein [Microbacteriaceae bacterium]
STTKDNALDSITETQQIPPGQLTRQSVSVAVDQAAAAKNGVTPQQVNSLVSAAAGINAKRGDAVSVQFVNFSKANALAAKTALAQAAAQARAQQIQAYIRDGAIALGILLAGFFVYLGWRRSRRSASQELVPTGIDGIIPNLPPAHPAVPEFQAVPTSPAPQAPGAGDPGALDARRRRSEIEAMAENDPKKAAEYLRGLMDDRTTA